MKPPIADPSESRRTVAGNLFFRSFWRIYFVYLLGLVAGLWFEFYVLLEPVFRSARSPAYLWSQAFFTISPFFFALIPALLDCSKTIAVDEKTLKGSNWWGVSRVVSWEQIQTVKFRWFFFPYALISTAQKDNVIWLPLVLKDMLAFTRAVEERTTPDNPLRLFLQKRGY